MEAKKLNKKHSDWENEKEKLDDPDYFPSDPSAKVFFSFLLVY